MMTRDAENKGAEARTDLDALGRRNKELEQLLEAKEIELTAARDGIDTLAHSISHDLRSPLHIIGGFGELLAKQSARGLDEKGRRFLGRITTATVQIGGMIDEILELSRMSRCEMHCTPIDLEPLVRKAVHDLDAEKGGRRVIWIIGDLPTVCADPTMLGEAIASLASNAFKHTFSREVARIQIGMQEAEGELRFFVRDNGASADIKQRERLFDVDPGRLPSSSPNMGTSRLAYVQRILQRHGGRVWAEAQADGGATFYFALPASRAEMGVSAPPL